MKKTLFWLSVLGALLTTPLVGTGTAQVVEETKDEASSVQEADEVVVRAEKTEGDGPFLPQVEGTRINAGKKTSLVSLKEMPSVTNNNYRQALVKTPGLLLSEETTPLVSIGYRGLNPDRAQFIQVMKDGIPIVADMFGYPEAYYTPILQNVDKIEFIRGGSGLMYGPQPGGALNYVTHKPATDTKLRMHSENTFGSDNYFSTYESITGTLGPLGYLGYIHERQGDGFRQSNSDYEVLATGMKVTLNQTTDSRLTLAYDEYHEEHGEPGGLTREQFEKDPSFVTRHFDRFRLERYVGSLIYEKEFSDETQFDWRAYGGYYRRWSKRQSGGGFGTLPTSDLNTIQEQEFYNLGFEPRLRHDYDLLGQTHTVTFGTHTFFSHSPLEEWRGFWPDAEGGQVRKKSIRDEWYLGVFLENLFRIGKLSITPGVRVENLWQRVFEQVNQDKTTAPLGDEKSFAVVPLFGLGVAYEVAKGIEAYMNISQSYRPKTFAAAVPTGSNQTINGNLKEGHGIQYDFGFRGHPLPFLTWDISYFHFLFKDQIGTVGTTIDNIGNTSNNGLEFYAEFDAVGAWDHMTKNTWSDTIGSISAFTTFTAMDAEIYSGPQIGRRPAFTPQENLRIGVNYRWRDRVKVALTGTYLDTHFADDASTPDRLIPSYKVWDLTGEVKVLKDLFQVLDVSVLGGVNNVFDESYYSRITSTGIDPGYRRNIYGGFKVTLNNPFERDPVKRSAERVGGVAYS